MNAAAFDVSLIVKIHSANEKNSDNYECETCGKAIHIVVMMLVIAGLEFCALDCLGIRAVLDGC